MLERYGHGGDVWTAAETFGLPKEQFLDFSSNMNPLGPPDAIGRIMRERWREVAQYPDPAVRELTRKLARKHGIDPKCILVGNGAAELIDLAVRALQPKVTGLVRPSFLEYEEAVEKSGGRVLDIPLLPDNGFVLQEAELETAAARCDLLFLGHPNNPTGTLLPDSVVRRLAAGDIPSIVDEAFLDFSTREESLTLIPAAAGSRSLIVIRSMTKFFSIPGIRLGYAVAHPELIRAMKRFKVHWSVNALAQWVGEAVLEEAAFAEQTLRWLSEEKDRLIGRLREIGLEVYDSEVNFILFSLKPFGLNAKELQTEMGRRGILIRDASLFKGLDESYVRIAVKLREHNEMLVAGLEASIAALTGAGERVKVQAQGSPLGEKRTLAPTLMLQGTASDVGKSLLTAALCRILLQDGYRVAPFKSQNMSLNSYVTPDGKEIGRAQGMQADACRIAATTDMNPILLKPKKDMVSQVVVHGKPYRDLDARAYRERYLPEAETVVKDALARLRRNYDVVVIEGAGSPAEVNLKDRDIVNMRLAGWADAPVLLVADIDRGGVFASLVGTLDILTPEERARVKGFVINKFRGDVTLLQPGIDWLEQRTGKPVLGVIPYLPQLGLEDEDSASLDRRLAESGKTSASHEWQPDMLDIAVIRLPRISNFTDIDPLSFEPDVRLRFVTGADEFGSPDAVIVPGSKNTVDDLLYLRQAGLDRMLARYAADGGFVAGICAGYQMLGEKLLDPLLVESNEPELRGIGLFPAQTEFAHEKQTVRSEGTANLYGDETMPVQGYEIHMGQTEFMRPVRHPFEIVREDGSRQAEGAATDDGRIWGTYLHGILHNDDFRRSWLNRIRLDKGLDPLAAELRFLERREAAFDRLADHVRAHLDLQRLYAMIEA
ncbi:cobyric acid synthase [Paenibacillus allorhizosphaerae]|uniref:Cobyric acid synthase n=1 Tax=Paenibacillus allorhizosphaerae TaxID=2849866 RepID=A0ABM8VF33_9BACL|nr:cobyric acid synthase [Paenibacillus allorhizosphaerae]CAG7633218.1 Cobyric acid synthase [Paenibacillus allorhizosphaerae]